MSVDASGPTMSSTPNSKKMMVAPQPHYRSHHRERNDDSCRIAGDHGVVQRRQSAGAIVPTYNTSQHADNRRSYSRDNPMMVGPAGDQLYYVDDRNSRTKSCGEDIRVAVLEQRVRELEAMVVGAQSPSTSTAPASFIIPVIGTKEGVCIKLEAYTYDRRLPTCMDTESNCGFFEVALLYRSYQGTNDDLDNG
uniref:CACTA en-spm transposon protein n=1 Tax=Ascaris lumbricoides TaxID=6252 RepID=A0A0M3ISN5_ASCLU